MKLQRIRYQDLNGKQQEIYNFQKIAAVLADYGFNCIKLSDDWHGADFLAYHKDGNDTLQVQLKGRLTISEKYRGKGLFIAFPVNNTWCLIEHDKLIEIVGQSTHWLQTKSWIENGQYHSGKPSRQLVQQLREYMLEGKKLGEIFQKEPEQWALRGDPYLWREMAAKLASTPLPADAAEFLSLVEAEFLRITGKPMSWIENVQVPRFSDGGMSSGMVCPEYWRSQALPLLLQRFTEEIQAFEPCPKPKQAPAPTQRSTKRQQTQ